MQNLDRLAELAKDLPANLIENASSLVERMGEVIEGFGDKPLEWRPGTLKLVQATTDRTKIPKQAVIGSLLLGEDVVEQPFKVIPLRLFNTRQYWNPDQEKTQMICSSPDAKTGFQYGECYSCPYSKFDEEAKKSACNKSLTVLCISADLTNIFMINFTKTNYVNGTDWQTLMKKAGVSPYKRYYNLTTGASPKVKNVEIIKADPIRDEKVEGAVLAFVEEIFRLSGEDRAKSLETFMAYVESRRNNTAALLDKPDDHTMTLLASPEEDGQELIPAGEQESQAATQQATASKKAGKYSL